jgi:uncharacterized RDD family membrane protein YckC
MQCPSCGAYHGDAESCAELRAGSLRSTEPIESQNLANQSPAATTEEESKHANKRPTLIEFPGLARNTVPEWRRELSDRVREVQERRAREAAQEAAERERRRLVEAATAGPQLELLRRTPQQPLNPLVAAALRRIERANQLHDTSSALLSTFETRVETVACLSEDGLESLIETPAKSLKPKPAEPTAGQGEKTRNLAVVAATRNGKANKTESSNSGSRLLREDNGVLDYLLTVQPTIRLDEINERQAKMLHRVLAASIDLIVCSFLFSPFFAVVELMNGQWWEGRTLVCGLAFATFLGFSYLTFCTALAGRTWGMRILSLRTVDKKTGLIPTGAQSVGRAVLSLASLFAFGLPILYAILQGERRMAQDRLTGTAVVRA